ncbi:MAG: hypothetical protein ABSD74_16485 [Rhizomicrobium sp.]|jgi:hypothetical protein
MHKAILFDSAALMTFNTGEAFELHYEQGDAAPWSGRYACSCGREIVVKRGASLPGEQEHAGTRSRWRLLELSEAMTDDRASR